MNSKPSCVASLGLGYTARAEILDGDDWGTPKAVTDEQVE